MAESSYLIDTHFHLDLTKNPAETANEIEKSQIYTIAVTNAPAAFPFTSDFCSGKKFIRPGIGLHPQVVKERQAEISQFDEALKSTKYVGEIGLDFSENDKSTEGIQRKIFQEILRKCAAYGDKILSIHSRRSANDVVSMIGSSFPGKIILHWYSGDLKLIGTAIKYGFYFSVNYAMSKSKNGREIIKTIPADRILTETDGPFIKIGDKACEPTDILKTVANIAEILNKDASEIKKTVFSNFRNMLP